MIQVVRLRMLRCDAIGCHEIFLEHHFDAGQSIKKFREVARNYGWSVTARAALCSEHRQDLK